MLVMRPWCPFRFGGPVLELRSMPLCCCFPSISTTPPLSHHTTMSLDPFEARLQFIQVLETLNPSSLTISKAINFCIKNQELHEDFHAVILEVLDRIDLNARMNVLYFIEALVAAVATQNTSKEFEQRPYLQGIQKDARLILEKVVPKNNLANLNGCVDILSDLESFYPTVDNKDLRLIYKKLSLDNTQEKIGDVDEGFAKAWKFLVEKKKVALSDRLKLLRDKPTEEEPSEQRPGDDLEHLTPKQILQRMEIDRERHKRLKETNWVVNRPSGKLDREEFDRIWSQFGPVDEDDVAEMKELYKTANESYQV